MNARTAPAPLRRRAHTPRPPRCRLRLGALLAVLALGLLTPVQTALADADPGSDVLVSQNLFLDADAGVTAAQQVRLGELLTAAARQGVPIRVAVIATRHDLGPAAPLWHRPQTYARYLGSELSGAYRGRLLVVMPNGFGLDWQGHRTASLDRILARVPIAAGARGLVAAARDAVTAVAEAAGRRVAPGSGTSAGKSGAGTGSAVGRAASTTAAPSANPGANTPPAGTTGTTSGDQTVGLVALAVILLAALAFAGRRLLSRAGILVRPRGRTIAIGTAGLVALAAIAVLVTLVTRASTQTATAALATNPDLDPGTHLSGPAPNFTLVNQFGRPVSLRSYRGKVVLLSFTDSECTTLCPLTTSAMLDAEAMLRKAAKNVALLGVDANPKDNSVEDVLSYTQVHGMTGRWNFLTGSVRELRRVWDRYGIGVDISDGQIEHTDALYVISPRGRLSRVFTTWPSYAAVPQFGKLLATAAASLLPGHPRIDPRLSYQHIRGFSPSLRVSLPLAGGRGRARLGPGRARVLLFFATWDQEITSLSAHLAALRGYQALARKQGLPPLTAIDERPVEPSGHSLQRFLSTVPGRLTYPVAVDTTGQLGDGYGVSDLPTVEVTSGGRILWYADLSVLGWPSLPALVADVRAALAHGIRAGTSAAAVARALAGSPRRLASLHAQASQLLGGERSLMSRIRSLRGYPIVLNAWASYCGPCREEFGLFAQASAAFGKRVAFMGADTDDTTTDGRFFLAGHLVSYPSYRISSSGLQQLIPQGLIGLPTTIFLNRRGHVVYVHTGQYDALGTLDADIERYAIH